MYEKLCSITQYIICYRSLHSCQGIIRFSEKNRNILIRVLMNYPTILVYWSIPPPPPHQHTHTQRLNSP